MAELNLQWGEIVRSALEVWHLSGNDGAARVVEDVAGVDSLVDSLLASPSTFNLAHVFSLAREPLPSGFPSHELYVGVDPERSVGVMSFADDAGRSLVTDGRPDCTEVGEYHFMGHQRYFPCGAEISIDLIRRALKEFLSEEGKIPTCVEWMSIDDETDEPEWPDDVTP